MKKVFYKSSAAVLFILFAFSGCKTAPKATDESLLEDAPIESVVPAEKDKTAVSEVPEEKQIIEEPQYTLSTVDELEKQIIAAREKALLAGVSDYFPEEFAVVDSLANTALEHKEKGNFEEATKDGTNALLRYKTLTNFLKSLEYKVKIDQNNFAHYAQNEYDTGIDMYEQAIEVYGVNDEKAYDLSTEILRLAMFVNNEGFKVWAIEGKKKTEDARALCDSIKAQKSASNAYAKAVDTFVSAETFGKNNDWESAFYNYEDSIVQFVTIYQDVSLKRNAADVAIAAAKAKQERSKTLALQADELVPLPEDAEGFDADDEESLKTMQNTPMEVTQ